MNDSKLNKLIAKAFDLKAPPMPDFKAEAAKETQRSETKSLLKKAVELNYEQLDQLAAAKKSPDFHRPIK